MFEHVFCREWVWGGPPRRPKPQPLALLPLWGPRSPASRIGHSLMFPFSYSNWLDDWTVSGFSEERGLEAWVPPGEPLIPQPHPFQGHVRCSPM